ncbi:MAG: hypothetical protein HGB10_01440 [Coriobacteriia bacterium]|nr:hypothetical protein [Coriobacteriia bacterium]
MPVLIAVIGLGFAALVNTAALLQVGGESGAATISGFGETAMGVACGFIILAAARRIVDGPAQVAWACIGASVMFTAAGDAAQHTGLSSTTGMFGLQFSDALYGLAAMLFTAGLLVSILRYMDRVDFAWVATEAFVACTLLAALLWVLYLSPAITDLGGMSEPVLTHLTYLAADFVLMLAPTVCVIAVAIRLGDEYVAGPRLAVAAGVVLFVLSNLAWFRESTYGGRLPGSLPTFGFMVAVVLFASGAAAALAEEQRVARMAELHSPGQAS